jgi:hypothetical protein
MAWSNGTGAAPSDPIGAALDAARTVLAEVAHRGMAHLPASFGDRLGRAASGLTSLGLRRAGEAVTAFAGAVGPDPDERAVGRWVEAYLRVAVAISQRGWLRKASRAP